MIAETTTHLVLEKHGCRRALASYSARASCTCGSAVGSVVMMSGRAGGHGLGGPLYVVLSLGILPTLLS